MILLSQRRNRHRHRHGFTLVEIIIVVMLIGMIVAWGMPTFVQTFKRQPLQQAVNDIMEACASARAAAILSGAPADLVITGNPETMQKILSVQRTSSTTDPLTGEASSSRQVSTFTIPETIDIELLYVNFQDGLSPDSPTPRVRFHPNGTSDEFTISLLERSTNKRRMISLDVVTAHAGLKTESELAAMKR